MAATSGARFESEAVARRAPQDEYLSDPGTTERMAMYKKDKEEREAASNVIEQLVWIAAAVLVVYHFEVIDVLLYSDLVLRNWLSVGAVCWSVFVGIGLYYGAYMPYVQGVEADLENAQGIPVAVVFMLLGAATMTIAVWPVWGLLTPVLGFVIVMGIVMLTAFMP